MPRKALAMPHSSSSGSNSTASRILAGLPTSPPFDRGAKPKGQERRKTEEKITRRKKKKKMQEKQEESSGAASASPNPGTSAKSNLSRTQNRVEQPRSIPAPGRGHPRMVFVLKK
jgi:hypothetical protein